MTIGLDDFTRRKIDFAHHPPEKLEEVLKRRVLPISFQFRQLYRSDLNFLGGYFCPQKIKSVINLDIDMK